MKENNPDYIEGPRPTRGEIVDAVYNHPKLEDYGGNPLIEALPPMWNWDDDLVMDKLNSYSVVLEPHRNQPSHLRMAILRKLPTFFQILKRHRCLEQNLSSLLRGGYVGRNPIRLKHRRDLHDRVEELKTSSYDIATGGNLGLAILGSPGLGKTISVERILKLYPQVIQHQQYNNQAFTHTQVVWLVLTCPHDGSTRGLCLSFFSELDSILGKTRYFQNYARANEDAMIAAMASLAATLSLGVLVIDEIQFLSAAKSGGKAGLLKFFVQLQNVLGIPVVLVGTNRAVEIVAGSLHQARRSVGGGGAIWEPLTFEDPEWGLFLGALWKNQCLKQNVPLTPELTATMFEETQGILDFAVKLFICAQKDAINDETETISVDGLRMAAQKHMKFIRPYILALRNKDETTTRVLEDALIDVVSPDLEDDYAFFGKLYPLPARKPVSEATSRSVKQPVAASQAVNPVDAPIPAFQGAPVDAKSTLPPAAKKRAREKVVFPKGSIMAVCAEAKEINIAPYEALKGAGLIKEADEFLPAVAS